MLGGVSSSGNSFINEIITGFCDALPILIMGILLGARQRRREQNSIMDSSDKKSQTIIILLFAGVYTGIRYIAYAMDVIQSGYLVRPYATAVWTIVMGLIIGMVYILLADKGRHVSRVRTTLKFSVITFGVNWSGFIIFMGFVFSGLFVQSMTRMIMDVLSVMVSCILVNILRATEGKNQRG